MRALNPVSSAHDFHSGMPGWHVKDDQVSYYAPEGRSLSKMPQGVMRVKRPEHTCPWVVHTQAGSCCSGSERLALAGCPLLAPHQLDVHMPLVTAALEEVQAAVA